MPTITMSYSNTTPSIVIENCGQPTETVTIFHDPADAQALWDTLTISGSGANFLYLQPQASKEMKQNRSQGYYVDAYGVTRIIPTGVAD